MTIAARPRRFPAWLLPVAFAVVLVIGMIAVLLLARRTAAPDVPPEPPAFQRPPLTRPVVALDVQQAANGRLTLSDGSRDVQLRSDVRIDVLRPETAAGVQPGDWLGVIGIPNEIRNFAIRALVLLPGGPADADGVRLSTSGFAGHEAARDQNERPLLGGTVTRVDGRTVMLQGPAGPLTVDLSATAPLRRLAPGTVAEIREGDRIAFHSQGSGGIADAGSVLVLPGGAR